MTGRVASIAGDWLAAERGRFALWLPVFLGAGDLAYFTLRAEPPPWAAIALLVPALLAALLARRWPFAQAAFALAAAAAIGFGAAQFAAARAPPLLALPTRATVISGTVRAVEVLPEGRRITLASPRLAEAAPPLARTLRIRLRDDDPGRIETGAALSVRAMVRGPSPPAYPGGWDVQRDAYFNGIGGYGYALGWVEVPADAGIAGPHPGGFMAWVRALRETIASRIAAAVPGPTGAIATTLLTGITSAIPEPDRAAFRDSGLAHLLAIAAGYTSASSWAWSWASRGSPSRSRNGWRCTGR